MNDKVFADTNIVIDFLLDRTPHSDPAIKLLKMAEAKKIELFVSAGSYDTLYYVLRKNLVPHADCIRLFKRLNRIVKMVAVDKDVVENAIESNFSDIEDAIQYFSARKVKGLKTIISRDKKGFNKGKMTILSAEEYLKTLN